jgi:hypothetical protein
MRRYDDQMEFVKKRIADLEDELQDTRRDLVELMPRQLADLLMSYRSCESRQDYDHWTCEVLDRIASGAERDPSISHLEDRGWCPLCKGGSSGPYSRGFALPEGLMRHLTGRGNTAQCPVTRAAFRMARYALRDEFRAADEAKRRATEARRATERLFLVDPSSPPCLLDERLWFQKERSAEELVRAEERLRDLNFQVEINENVVAYKLQYEEFVVLADPRPVGRIDFCVFELAKNKRRSCVATFRMMDNWKNDLTEKFRRRLVDACNTLRTRGSRSGAVRKRGAGSDTFPK